MSLMDDLSNQPGEPNTNELMKDENQSYLDKLVAEKGENWKDPEVLAKGKLESDNYIAELKRQMDELKAKAIEGDTVSKLLAELEKRAGANSNNTPNTPVDSLPNANNNVVSNPGEGEAPLQPMTPEQVAELVSKSLSDRETASVSIKNETEVKDFLIKNYGTEAGKIVGNKARELGMSVDDMDALAKKSPTAFFNLIGVAPQTSSPTLNGDVNSLSIQNQNNPNVRDWQHYQRIRRENPKL